MTNNKTTPKATSASDLPVTDSTSPQAGLVSLLTNEQEKKGQLFRSSLSRVIEVLFERLQNKDFNGKVLIHLPASMMNDIAVDTCVCQQLESGTVYSCSSVSGSVDVECLNVLSLPENHPMQRELLIIIVSDTTTFSMIASPNKTKRLHEDEPWNIALSLKINGVITNCKILKKHLKNNVVNGKELKSVNKWIDTAVKTLEQKGEPNPHDDWAEMLIELLFILEKQRHQQDRELQWHKLMSRIQDSISWELDPNKLFTAINQILKATIGFHYLELQILDDKEPDHVTKATFQQNYTDFGGPLLTIILQDDKQQKILEEHAPVLVDPDACDDTLMNPLLLKYMGLKSGIIVPICHSSYVNGLMKLFAKQPNHFSADDIPRFEVIGRIISKSIKNVKAHSIMRRMATTDGLTGIYNHRFFMEQMTREFKRAVRYKTNLTLIMADIDYFKHYNDTNGHLQGDYVLVEVGKLLLECVRSADIVARYGGEEFMLVLPETKVEQGEIVCEKIRQAMKDHPFKFGEKQPNGQLSLSLGVSTLTPDIKDATELINRADIALYRSKKNGRNCHTVY